MTPTPDITIRLKPAGMSWDDVHRLLWQAHRPNRERGIRFRSATLSGEELERTLGPAGFCLVAFDGGKAVGTASLSLVQAPTAGGLLRAGTVRFVGVLPYYAGQGIASRLIAGCEKIARSLFCQKLFIGTLNENQRANGGAAGPPSDLHLRLGFRRPDPAKASFVKELG